MMNTLTHIMNPDGSLSRKPAKEGKRKKKGKIVPAKGKTPWGRIYPDGREVCDLRTAAGRREYGDRVDTMVIRQGSWCKCGLSFTVIDPTFGHDIPRGMGGGLRDDRIWDAEGKPMNHAECLNCNMEKGSKRI